MARKEGYHRDFKTQRRKLVKSGNSNLAELAALINVKDLFGEQDSVQEEQIPQETLEGIESLKEQFITDYYPDGTKENDEKICFALAYHEFQYYDKAIVLFDEVLSDEPDNYFALENRAIAHYEKLDYIKAIEDFSNCLTSTVDPYLVYWYLASCYLGNQQWENALNEIESALATIENNTEQLTERQISALLIKFDICHQMGNNAYKNNDIIYSGEQLSQCITIYDQLPKERRTPDVLSKTLYALQVRGELLHRKRATFEYALKDLETAEDVYDALKNADEEAGNESLSIYLNVLKIKSEIYRAKGELNESLSYLNALLALDENHVYALESRGSIYRVQGHDDAALRDLDKAIELSPDSYFGLENRGAIYCKQGKFEDAEKDLTKSINLNPNKNSIFAHLYRGDVNLQLGNYDFALEDFNVVISNSGDNHPQVYLKRGEVYLKQGKVELALDDFKVALDKSNKSIDELQRIVGGLIRECKFDIALKVLDMMLRVDSNCVIALELRGCVFRNTGDLISAQHDLTTAISKAGEHASAFAYENRGAVYFSQGTQESYNTALDDFDAAIKIDPNSVLALRLRGTIYNFWDSHKEALEDLNKSIEIIEAAGGSIHMEAYYERGYAQSALGNYADAVLDFTKVVDELAEQEKHITTIEQATEMSGKTADVKLQRGVAYMRQGDLVNAKKDLHEAYNLNRHSEEIKAQWEKLQKMLPAEESEDEESSSAIKTENESHEKLSKTEVVESSEGEKTEEEVKKSEERKNSDHESSSESQKDNKNSEEEEKSTDDSSSSSEEEEKDKEPSAVLTFKMLDVLYEQQQKAAEKQRNIAQKLYWALALPTLGLGSLIVYLIVEKLLRMNDVVKLEKQDTADETYKPGKIEWNKTSNPNDDGTFDLYFCNDKAFKLAQALEREGDKSSKVEAQESDAVFTSS